MIRRTFVVLGLVLGSIGLLANTAGADHAVAHNGETAEISKSDGLTQDETVMVTGIGYAPGSTLTVVQCFTFPAAGPTDCELSNYGLHTAEVDDEGFGTVEYVVNVVDGKCDASNPCFIVVSDGIGPSANGVGLEVTFADPAAEQAAAEQAAAEEAAAEEAAAEEAAAEEAAAEEAAAERAAAERAAAEEAAADEEAPDNGDDSNTDESDDSDSDGDGGGSGWIVPVVIVGAVIAAGGAFAATRRGGSS